jgi:hypothetical protein
MKVDFRIPAGAVGKASLLDGRMAKILSLHPPPSEMIVERAICSCSDPCYPVAPMTIDSRFLAVLWVSLKWFARMLVPHKFFEALISTGGVKND